MLWQSKVTFALAFPGCGLFAKTCHLLFNKTWISKPESLPHLSSVFFHHDLCFFTGAEVKVINMNSSDDTPLNASPGIYYNGFAGFQLGTNWKHLLIRTFSYSAKFLQSTISCPFQENVVVSFLFNKFPSSWNSCDFCLVMRPTLTW